MPQELIASGLVIDGRRMCVPGLLVSNWFDDPTLRLKMGEDGRARRVERVRLLTVHSTKGIPGGKNRKQQVIRPGRGPAGTAAERTVRYWTGSEKSAGAHLIVDFDGTVVCTADLQTEATYHATSVNDVSIGIEVVQGEDATSGYFYDAQLDAVVQLLDWLTLQFVIQRQFPGPFPGRGGWVPRLVEGGKTCVGVHQHVDQTTNRGEGDSGPWLRDRLRAAGYEEQDWSQDVDRQLWRARQNDLKARGQTLTDDGIPLDQTVRALQGSGLRPSGLWVPRPIDRAA